MPDPILVGRNERSSRAGASARRRRAGRTDLDAALADPRRRDLLRRASTGAARRADPAGDRRRQARLLREAVATDRRDALDLAARGRARGRQARRRAGQALAAGAAQAQALIDGGLLRPHPLGARRVRLLGLRGRLAGRRSARPGTTARKTAAASSSTCSATGATCSTTSSATVQRVSCLGATHIPERVDEHGAPLRGDRRRRRLRDVRARGRHHRADQLARGACASAATSSSTFQVDGTHGSAVAGLRDC